MKLSRMFFISMFVLLLTGCIQFPAYADVAIKIVAVNPSDTQEQEVPIRYELPEGIQKKDVKDTGVLTLDYDVDRGVYFVKGKVKMAPKESRVFKVVVNDIWKIPDEKIDKLLDLLDKNLALFEDSDLKMKVDVLGDKIRKRLNLFKKENKELESDIEKRLQKYRSDLLSLKEIKEEIFSLERLSTLKGPKEDQGPTVKLVVEAENPSEKMLEIPMKYYLPADIKPEYIVDSAGFNVEYDIEQQLNYLEKKETFKPGETKKFVLSVKDVWNVPKGEIDSLLKEADTALEILQSPKYKELAEALYKEIVKDSKLITETQKMDDTVEGKITLYKVNEKRLAEIKEDILMMRQLGVKEIKKKHNVLRDIKVNEDIQQVSDVLMKKIFKEGRISLFKMILAIVIFVIFITLIASLAWLKGIKDSDNRKLDEIEKESENNSESENTEDNEQHEEVEK